MDFDEAKENIQPLAAGRNASILQAALHAESHQELLQQRRQYEKIIMNYEGDDPLEPWFEYIYWIEQSYPSGGKESGLEEVLLKCLTKFEKDERYQQDRRMIKLYIKYIDTHENPQECYQKLYNQGIGTMVADLYICWAYYYDLSGNFAKADQIFRRGIDCRAQPLEELQEAHQHFGFTMSQRILYVDDNSKQKYQSSLQEKRQVLTSLKSQKKKVGSVRTGSAVKSTMPGRVQLNSESGCSSSRSGNHMVRVFEDENQDPNEIPLPEPIPETSVVKTILDSARKQENVKEPGPWNKAHDKKRGELFGLESRTDLGFEILEDEESKAPIKGKINFDKPFIYFDGFVERNRPQEEWNLPVTLENELIAGSYPSYDKCLLYPQPNMEFSLEELGCYLLYKKRNIENNFTKKYDQIWKSNAGTGIRMYPNFARKNQPLLEEANKRGFDSSELVVEGKCRTIFDPKLCYPSEVEELQFEEVMYRRWKNGERKLKYGGNETIAIVEEMEETICLPKEAARRKSFFPTRKSIAPSQFARLPTNVEDDEENEARGTPTPQRNISNEEIQENRTEICETKSDGNGFTFKTPAAPSSKQQKLNFQIYEEEENYEGNETCSTQVFNCFINAQSVSTPKAPTKVVKPFSIERQPPNLNFSGIENVPVPVETNLNPNLVSDPNPSAAFSPPEYNDVGLTMQGKQLSTIMETSEHATGNTASTKSSLSSADLDVEGQPSKIPITTNVCTLETVQEAGSLAEKDSVEHLLIRSLKLDDEPLTVRQYQENFHLEQKEEMVQPFEEKTETMSRFLFPKVGNFSRLEDKEDTTPSIKPIRFHEDKTETITKMILPPKKINSNEISTDDEMFEFFSKSPVKNDKAKVALNTDFSPPTRRIANKSIFTASAFMNFEDSPESKLKCNYDSPDLKIKRSSLLHTKEPKNSSFLPSFDLKAKDTSFLPNLSSNFDFITVKKLSNASSSQPARELEKQQPKESPVKTGMGEKLFKDDSFLPGFSKNTAACKLPRQKSAEDSFLSGFPSVAVGVNKPREDSFMSYLSNIGTNAKTKQMTENSFMNKFPSKNSDSEKKEPDISFYANRIASQSLSKYSQTGGKLSDESCKSTTHEQESLQNSSLPNFSQSDRIIKKTTQVSPQAEKESLGDVIMGDVSTKAVPQFPKQTNVSFLSQRKSLSTENATNIIKASTQEQSLSLSKSSQEVSKGSFLESKKLHAEENVHRLSRIPHLSQRADTSKLQNSGSRINQSQSNSTLSLFNSFTRSPMEMQKQIDQQKFSIFEDLKAQKETAGAQEINQHQKFQIFEDSDYQKSILVRNVNKSFGLEASIKPDDFFEDNIRTEAFATNLSMIKNSTWLPNHDPCQSQMKEQSLYIKEENSKSSSSFHEKTRGLSMFSAIPQEKSVDLMPPPLLAFKTPKVSVKVESEEVLLTPNVCIEIAESDDEEDIADFGKSIYYTKTPKTPKDTRHAWSPGKDSETPEMNAFVHRQVDLDHTQQVIDEYYVAKNVNPFDRDLLNTFIDQIDFTNYIEKLSTCQMVGKIQPIKKDSTIIICGKTFNVIKLIGEGSYGAVYCAREPHTGRMFAMKQERPANLWEYYIALELRSRLNSPDILSGFMNIEYALIGNNAGILVSKLSRYGSLITVCNKIKKETLKNVDEYVVMHMASQLLLIMDHLHASNIIHADVKADNFLLMEKLVLGRKQPTIQLIDFGTSIDMDLFKKGQTFDFIHTNESFKCVEMHEKRPWTYQPDLFGLAGVIHVLLFGKYMEIVKKVSGWTHKTHIPRYFNKTLWEIIFHSLLNIDDCQTMPNLQNLRAQLEEEIAEKKLVCQKIVEFNRALDL